MNVGSQSDLTASHTEDLGILKMLVSGVCSVVRTLFMFIHNRHHFSLVTNTRDQVNMVTELVKEATMIQMEQADTLASGLVTGCLWLSATGNLIQTAVLLHKETLFDSWYCRPGQSPLFATQSSRQTHPKRLKETQPPRTASIAIVTYKQACHLSLLIQTPSISPR